MVRERYANHLRPGLLTEPWTQEEDQALLGLVRNIGPKLAKIAEMFPGRSVTSVKNRYYYHYGAHPRVDGQAAQGEGGRRLRVRMRKGASVRAGAWVLA
jgi:hypothetical protein